VDIARAVRPDYPEFGLLTDLSHFPLLDETPEESIPMLSPWLEAVHLGNCAFRDKSHPAYGDIQPRFGLPGGETDTPEVTHLLPRAARERLLRQARAPHRQRRGAPRDGRRAVGRDLANAKRVIRDAWALSQRRLRAGRAPKMKAEDRAPGGRCRRRAPIDQDPRE
jgi:hypothetical protein